MAERKEVIDILGACGTDDCDNCPLNGDERCSGFVCVPAEVLRDAIALLKEQEARVMTLEEVTHSEDWIWYQWKNTHCGWTIVVDCDEEWIEWEDLTTDQLCKYGKKWRCWTSRPTEQQMRDTPWEGK